MDLKVCDRCGAEFRVVQNEHVVPVESFEAGEFDSPKPPNKLQHLNRVTIPLVKHDTTAPTDYAVWHTLFDADLCVQCVIDFEPIAMRFMSDKAVVK